MFKKIIPATALVAATLLGGAVGATMLGTANAATPSTSTSTTTSSTGKWHSNTDPAHEAGESAARQAAEAQADATGVAPAQPSATGTTG